MSSVREDPVNFLALHLFLLDEDHARARARCPTILSGARERSRTMRATIGYQARCLSGTANAITCGSKWPQMHATSAGRRVMPMLSAHEVCTFRAHALAFPMTSIVSPLRHRPDA